MSMLNSTFFRGFSACIALLLTVAVIGCDNVGSDDGSGTVQVLLTDAPLDNIAEANVTVERVELVGEPGTIVVMDNEESFNLLELQNGVTEELASEEVPAGRYHQIRFVVEEEATLVFDDGETSTLKVPSGTETGIKLNLPGGFEVGNEAERASILLDFDAGHSFVKAGASGKYIFKPVVRVESVEIEGEEFEDSPELTGRVTAEDDSRVEIEGIELALNEFTDFDFSDGDSLQTGDFVEADVVEEDDGTWTVLEVEPSDENVSMVKAPLEDVLGAAVAALGTSFDVTSGTEFEGFSGLTDLEAGNFVRITFSHDASADTYTASKIDFEGENGAESEED